MMRSPQTNGLRAEPIASPDRETQPPRVLHVLAPAKEGGLERVVTLLAVKQLNGGVHVAAVVEPAEETNHPFIVRLRSRGVPVTPIVVGGRGYLSEYRALRDVISRLRPTLVHTHGYRSDVIGTIAALRSGVPSVSTAHGFTGGSARNRLNEFLQRRALRRAAAVIAVAEPIAARLIGSGVKRSRVFCVRNGFQPNATMLDRDAARARLGIDPKTFVVGWVGRLSHEKGADVMIAAVSKCDFPAKLSLIGDGSERARLHELTARLGLEQRVTWHGSMPDAASVFPAFDVFVLSSRSEGTPIALFEAMDASVPIVATSVGGVPDVITSEHAVLVPPEDPEAIADALNAIRLDARAARERAARARDRLVSEFGESAWISAVDAVYRAALINVPSRG